MERLRDRSRLPHLKYCRPVRNVRSFVDIVYPFSELVRRELQQKRAAARCPHGKPLTKSRELDCEVARELELQTVKGTFACRGSASNLLNCLAEHSFRRFTQLVLARTNSFGELEMALGRTSYSRESGIWPIT